MIRVVGIIEIASVVEMVSTLTFTKVIGLPSKLCTYLILIGNGSIKYQALSSISQYHF